MLDDSALSEIERIEQEQQKQPNRLQLLIFLTFQLSPLINVLLKI